MCIVKTVFIASKLVTSLAVLGLGLAGLGIDNPIIGFMNNAGEWLPATLVICGGLNIAAMIWWGMLKKADCCKEKCGQQK